ncbi:hypothetical protein [Nitrososphaera sp. AFS]|uniref:hypothetical protein n=1 Tax=Nitrososphaera sp. AFS TaxID=2301191 RepID=UPI00139230BB|nr:hypothetical protein [Nitrososphaera sp. AFS]NAL77291.1 hypothetical protein [Nitrososphaera sp. AFS]
MPIVGVTGDQSEYKKYLQDRHRINLDLWDIPSESVWCAVCNVKLIPGSKGDLLKWNNINPQYCERLERELTDNQVYLWCKSCCDYMKEPASKVELTGWPTKIKGGAVYCSKCIKDNLPKPSLLPRMKDGRWKWYCLNCKYTEKMDPSYQKRTYEQNSFVVSKTSNRKSNTDLDKDDEEDLQRFLGIVAPGAHKVDQS